jgi:hypothetical protein
MMKTRRNDFIQAVADFLKISLENSITKEYLEVETGFIADEWYLDFINHLGNTKAEYKRPLDLFTSAINSYKAIKFEKLYATVSEQSKTLLDKLQATFRIFDNGTIPPEDLTYLNFIDKDPETNEKKPTFTKKQLEVLAATGDWHYLFGRRNDTYGLIQMIEAAYKKSIDKKIKDTAITLGNAPQVAHQATKLIKLVDDEAVEVRKDNINPNMAALLNNAARGVRVGA